ncbi:LysR family transcriptional regulator [Roseomonas sp. GCM10028921]
MTLRQLTYFLKIAELGSFSRAAAVLHIAQPALSRQIKQLEADLGVQLFARSDTGISLTEAGKLLADQARVLMQRVEGIRSEVSALAKSVQGKLHFGLPTSLFDLVTVPLTAHFRHRYPAVNLGITEGISATIHRMVVAGDLDVGIVSSTESMSGLEQYPLISEALFLAYPPSLPVDLRADGSVTLDQVVRHPLALTQWPNAMRVLLEHAAKAEGLELNPLFDSNSSRLMVKAVVNGLGATVNTYSALCESHRSGAISLASIVNMTTTWTLVCSRERGMPVAGRRLAELVIEISKRQIDDGIWLGAAVL